MMSEILLTMLLSNQGLFSSSKNNSGWKSQNDGFSSLLTSLMSNNEGSQPGLNSSFGNSSLEPVLLLLLNRLLQDQSKSISDKSKAVKVNKPFQGSPIRKDASPGEPALGKSKISSAPLPPSTSLAQPKEARSNQTIPGGRPVDVGSLTQGYSARHYGLDFGIVQGTPVKSTQSGKVTYSGWNSQGYGNLVVVDNGTYSTYYGHLSKLPLKVGDEVKVGQVIGMSGNTGNSTGPHLHYEIRKNGSPIDPTYQTLGRK